MKYFLHHNGTTKKISRTTLLGIMYKRIKLENVKEHALPDTGPHVTLVVTPDGNYFFDYGSKHESLKKLAKKFSMLPNDFVRILRTLETYSLIEYLAYDFDNTCSNFLIEKDVNSSEYQYLLDLLSASTQMYYKVHGNVNNVHSVTVDGTTITIN